MGSASSTKEELAELDNSVLTLTLNFSATPSLVVTNITPFAPRAPYNAAELASFITEKEAISSGFILARSEEFISIPSISIDMAGAILSVPAIQYGFVSDHALLIETIFEEDKKLVAGNLFFLPDLNSFDKILTALGVN